MEKVLGRALREYTIEEVKENLARLKKLEGDDGTPPAPSALPPELKLFVENETNLSLVNFRYWAERYAQIVTDKKRMERFSPWPSQEYFLKKVAEEEEKQWEAWRDWGKGDFAFKAAFIWVKSRQVGGTRLAQVLMAHLAFMMRNTYAIIASDTPEKGLELWRLLDKLYGALPYYLVPSRSARVKGEEHFFEGIGSTIAVGAGNQKGSLGQGVTVDAFHLSEVSTWDPEVAEMIDDDLLPAFDSSRRPYSLGLVESTAKGGSGNWFGKQWEVSIAGKSEMIPLFLSWFHCPDKFRDDNPNIVLMDDTLSLADRIEARFPDIHLEKAQLAWYQKKREEAKAKGKLGQFLQERPSFPEEAFEHGTQSIFSLETRQQVKEFVRKPKRVYRWEVDHPVEAEWDGDPAHADGLLLIWEDREDGKVYGIGVDGSHGKEDGDYHAVEVVKAPVAGGPAEQVAEWVSRGGGLASLDTVTRVSMFLGELYKGPEWPAVIAPESNPGSPSAVVTMKLMEAGYPNIYVHRRERKYRGERFKEEMGWQTNEATRGPLTLRGRDALTSGELIIHSSIIFEEMKTFEKTFSPSGKAKFEHAEGKHDDALIALFIAYWVVSDESMVMTAEEALRAARRAAREEKPANKVGGRYTIVLGIEPGERDTILVPLPPVDIWGEV